MKLCVLKKEEMSKAEFRKVLWGRPFEQLYKIYKEEEQISRRKFSDNTERLDVESLKNCCY
jgi:hypothetical protein